MDFTKALESCSFDELYQMSKLLYKDHSNPDYRKKFAEFEEMYKNKMYKKSNYDRITGTRMTVEYYEKSCANSAKAREEANNLYKQKKHDLKIHHQILFKYSQSVAVAPIGSEELALAVSNRSIFSMHLKKYSNSVKDIDYALSITKSEVLKSKLLCRKVHCLLEMNQKDEGKSVLNEAYKSLENLKKEDEKIKNNLLEGLKKSVKLLKTNCKTYKAPKRENLELEYINDLPYISESVSFTYDMKFGKHLLANRDIAAGEILIVEQPYCLYPDLRELYYVCSHCLKFCFNSIPCSRCVFAVYCSSKCQKAAFEEYHDIECTINPELYKDPIETINLIMSRFFIKLIKSMGIKKIIQEVKYLDNLGISERYDSFVRDTNNKIKNSSALQFFYDFLTTDVLVRDDNADDNVPPFFLGLLKKHNYFSDELSEKNMSILNEIFSKIIFNVLKNFLGIQRNHYAIKINDYLLETKSNPNGIALTQSWNFINHNCYPNANKFFINEGGKLVIFASRPIKKNEQVYVTYGAKINRTKEEREKMLKPFNFKCNCLVCKNNWPKIDDQMVIFLERKIKSNKHEYPKLASLVDEFVCKSFKEFDEWKQDKNKIKKVCEKLDKTYSKQPSFEDVAIIDDTRYFLTHLFSVVYNDDFEMSENC